MGSRRTDSRELRRVFFSSLTTLPHDALHEDLRQVCKVWRQATEADWVWLWSHNSYARFYELSGYSSKEANREVWEEILPQEAPQQARATPVDNDAGIGHYASVSQQPVHHSGPPSEWSTRFGDKTYKILLHGPIAKLESRDLTYVPLIGPRAEPGDLVDLISYHYRDPKRRRNHRDEDLMAMGRITARLIEDAQVAKKARVDATLRDLTIRLEHASPRERLKRYLDGIIDMIRTLLHVEGVSIMLKHRFNDSLYCAASTGLLDPSGQRVADRDLASVTYQLTPGESLTADAYLDNKPRVSPTSATRRKSPRYVEDTPNKNPINSVLIQSIPGISIDTNRGLGVIRCAEHKSPLFAGDYAHFRPSAIQTLQHIVKQIGPMLQFLRDADQLRAHSQIVRHEVNTPLAAIRDVVETSSQSTTDPQQKESLVVIGHACYRALQIANDLDFGDVELRNLSLRSTAVLSELVRPIAEMLDYYARVEKGMNVEVLGSNSDHRVMMDRRLAERALGNLVTNAVKFGIRDTTITIKVTATQKRVRIAVENEGPGVPSKDRTRIFREGYRCEQAAYLAGPGTGLGLSIAESIMKSHGGSLKLASLSAPTVFELVFPKTTTNARVDHD